MFVSSMKDIEPTASTATTAKVSVASGSQRALQVAANTNRNIAAATIGMITREYDAAGVTPSSVVIQAPRRFAPDKNENSSSQVNTSATVRSCNVSSRGRSPSQLMLRPK